MKTSGTQRPFISAGSFFLGAAILAVGMVAAWNNADGGAIGWGLYWPVAVAAPVAAMVNAVAICSPGGSIFNVARELIKACLGGR